MKKGFTLIEVIIYIALFSILMGTAFITAYQLIDGSGKLSIKNTIQEEGNFVMRKIDWALTGISNDLTEILNPPQVSPYTSSTLSIKKWIDVAGIPTKIPIIIQYDGTSSILMQENINQILPITTVNVKVTFLQFQFIPASGSGPAGIKADFIITKDGVPFPFTITKYIRK